MPKLDLSKPQEALDNVNRPVPPGDYEVTVKNAKYEIDSQDRPKVIVDFEDNKNQVFRKWFYLHIPDTKRISLEHLGRLGLPPNWNPKNSGELVGKTCRIQVGEDKRTNDKGEEVKYASVEKIFQRNITPGTYRCKIDTITKQENAAKSGKSFRRVFFKILDAGECQHLKIMDRLYFNEESMKFTASKLQSMGASRADFDTDNEHHMSELIGRVVEITLSVRRGSNGIEYPDVRNIKLLEGDAGSPGTPAVSADGEVELTPDEVAGYDEDEEDEIPF